MQVLTARSCTLVHGIFVDILLTMQLQQTGQSLYVDPKSNVVHCDGNPKLAEEYEERVWLGFQTVQKEEKTSYAAKLKNALHGRAWTLCHRKPEIAAQKLLQISEAEPSANAGPKAAVQLVVRTVRAACEKVAPLLKTQTFEDYFFEKGRRRLGESIQDYISPREGEYEKLSGLTKGHTKLSTDLQAFFLLRNAGVTPPQHQAILGQAGNEYGWDKIVEAMLFSWMVVMNRKAKVGRATTRLDSRTATTQVASDHGLFLLRRK